MNEDQTPFDRTPADACEAALADHFSVAGLKAAPSRETLDHFKACASCEAELGELHATEERLRSALAAVPDVPGLPDEFRRAAAQPPVPTPVLRLPRPALFAAAAAVLLLAVGVAPVLSSRTWWGGPEPAPTAPPAAPRSWARFTEAGPSAGLALRHGGPADQADWMAESVGSGAVAADLDGDNLPDLVFPDFWSLDEDRPEGGGTRVLRNRGDGTFEDITAASGLDVPERITGALAADLDNDGDRDLVFCGYGALRVFANDGRAVFTDVSTAAGLGPDGNSWFTCAAAADLDRDGVLDLYVTRYADQESYREARLRLGLGGGDEGIWRGVPVFAGPEPIEPQSDRLYRGLGDLRFEDVSAAALKEAEPRYGFQVVATDVDGDGWLDLYVANDTDPNSLWINSGEMTFEDRGLEAGCALDADGKAQAGMGVAAGDVDGDGLPDFAVTNFSNDHATLYRNTGGSGIASFDDRSWPSGIGPATNKHLGWGALFLDADLDGHQDLVLASGHLYAGVDSRPDLGVSYADRLLLFAGRGDGRFESRNVPAEPGFGSDRVHRGLVSLDADGDGRLDLVATVLGGSPVLLRNQTERRGQWIRFRLTGTESPRDPAGAVVTVVAEGRRQSRTLHFGSSFASMNEPVLHFGLGEARQVDRVIVRWPSGRVQELDGRPAGRIHEIIEPAK
ncbi:MAG: CRTAC1 family protein [Planctomycetota bacterium]